MTNLEDCYDVHFGIKAENAEDIRSSPFIQDPVFIDGDGWNCWGEAPGTDCNDADTLHIIVRCDSIGRAINSALGIAKAFDDELVASNGAAPDEPYAEKQNSNLVVVSQAVDWAEQYLVIRERETLTLANKL